MKTAQNKERFDYIDIVRIIACLFVIYNHTNDRGFNWYQNIQNNTAIWIWDTVLAILSKAGVPLFFMVSGAMLLEKSEDLRRTYKRIPRILFDLIFFSAFYQILNRIHEGMNLSAVDIAKGIISTSIWHMWFLYAYLAFLITLPIMSQMIKGIDKEHFRLMLLIMIVLDGILPVLEFFTIPVESSLKPSWLISSIFMYPFIGYYIDKKCDVDKITNKHLLLLWTLLPTCLAINVLCEFEYLGNTENRSLLVYFCVIYAATIYITIKKKLKGGLKSSGIHNLISGIGQCVFGIYLFHLIIFHIWYRFTCGIFENHIGALISSVGVFCISCILTYLIRMIPMFRRFL